MISESQERMLCVVEPEPAARAARDVRALGGARHRDRRGHRHRRLRVLDGDELVGDMPVEALVDDCPLYDLEPEEPSEPALPRPAARARRRTPARQATLLALLGSPNVASKRFAFEQYDSIVGSRTVRRPEAADAAVLPLGRRRRQRRDRGVDRRQRPARGLRPVHRRGRGRARVRAQPRLRRRRAARPHQLPQLRQPREAAHRLAADARGRGPARRLPGARRAGGRRQRVALQRGRRTARSTPRRSSAWSASCPTPSACRWPASRRRATRSRSSARSRPTLAGSELEKLRGRLAGDLPAVDLATPGGRRSRALRAAVRDGRARHRARHLRGRPRLRAGGVLHRRRHRRAVDLSPRWPARTTRRRLFGEGPGGVLVAGPARADRAAPGRRAARRDRRRSPANRRVAGPRRGLAEASASRERSRLPSRDPAWGQRRPALVASLGAGNLGAGHPSRPRPPG